MNAPIAAKTGAHEGPGMWTPGGGMASILCLPRRGFGARRELPEEVTMTTTDAAKMRTGSIATTEFQSGMTNFAVSSRMPFHKSSNMATQVSRSGSRRSARTPGCSWPRRAGTAS